MIFRLCKSKTVLFIAVVLLLNFTVGFWFSGRVCAASEKYILGDANGDGKVNIHDVSYIQMILFERCRSDTYLCRRIYEAYVFSFSCLRRRR